MSASCRHCGTAVPDGSRFCPQCGMRLDDAATEATTTAVIPPTGRTWRDRVAIGVVRARGLLDLLRIGVSARNAIARARAERHELGSRRRDLLLVLGDAVYRGDEEETSSVRGRLRDVDAAIAEKEREMQRIAGEARREGARTRLESGPTQVIEPSPSPGEALPPEPARIPEPYPSPGEADPPEPARIPEPYPSPGEADPPEPARIPEPYPPPDEGDPPEPAGNPEPGGAADSRSIR